MILLYCDDISRRKTVHNYFRDKGVEIEAAPLNEFAVRSYACNISALLIVGNIPPGFSALFNATVPMISVSKYPVADSIHFRDYESHELFDILMSLSGNAECFEYNGVLKATPRCITFLGYEFNLTPAERSILSLLVSRADADVSCDEIGNACLGDIHSKNSTVARHISSINQKAENIGGRAMIIAKSSGCYSINKFI